MRRRRVVAVVDVADRDAPSRGSCLFVVCSSRVRSKLSPLLERVEHDSARRRRSNAATAAATRRLRRVGTSGGRRLCTIFDARAFGSTFALPPAAWRQRVASMPPACAATKSGIQQNAAALAAALRGAGATRVPSYSSARARGAAQRQPARATHLRGRSASSPVRMTSAVMCNNVAFVCGCLEPPIVVVLGPRREGAPALPVAARRGRARRLLGGGTTVSAPQIAADMVCARQVARLVQRRRQFAAAERGVGGAAG